MEKKIDSIFKIWHDAAGAGGQVLVTHKGKVIFDKCYGCADIEHKIPMTQDTVFYIASISKSITAMAIMMLHEQGKVDVDGDIRDYVPEYVNFPQKVTVRQLLDHTSGVRCGIATGFLQGRGVKDKQEFPDTLRYTAQQTDLSFTPGERFMYSNPNYNLLAAIVEKVTGAYFPAWVKENIFAPLGMEDSFVNDSSSVLVPNKACSYSDNGYSFENAIINCGVYGSTGVYSTCRDITKFYDQYRKPTLVSQQTLDKIAFHVPQVKVGTTISGGGVRVSFMEGHRHIHHGGVKAGNRTIAMCFPEDELVVAIFANVPNLPVETAARDIARVVLGLPGRKLRNLDVYKRDSVDLTEIPGFYRTESGSCSRFSCQDGQVYWDGDPLVHLGGNLYKLGRLNCTFALGDPIVKLQNNVIAVLEKYEKPVPAALAKEAAGSYYCHDLQTLWHIVYDGEKLWWEHVSHGKQWLRYLEKDTFFHDEWQLTLTRDETGKVNGYKASGGKIMNVPFEKVK